MIPSHSATEEQRLQAARHSNLLDEAQKEEFEALVRLIATITGCPVSLISIVDQNYQWFKAKTGLELDQTSRDISFCTHTIAQGDLMIVEDAHLDERFDGNPLVYGEYGVRFYAGVPFRSPDGYCVGTVCVLDQQPRRLNTAQIDALRLVAQKVAELLWLRGRNEELRRQYNAALDRIGQELHEDYAQAITACLKFMELAQDSEGMAQASIGRTQQVLQEVLNRMRQLSQQIKPIHFMF